MKYYIRSADLALCRFLSYLFDLFQLLFPFSRSLIHPSFDLIPQFHGLSLSLSVHFLFDNVHFVNVLSEFLLLRLNVRLPVDLRVLYFPLALLTEVQSLMHIHSQVHAFLS